MQFPNKSPAVLLWLRRWPAILCIMGYICLYGSGLVVNGPHAFAATSESTPGGQVTDPVVRQVDIARPAVVRIITTLNARLAVQFTPTSLSVTFPLDGGDYALELSGSGAFISAHGDILTADHVVNPPHDQSIAMAVYQAAASDVANYANTHLRTNQPYNSENVVTALEEGVFPSVSTYGQPSSEVYLSAAYAAGSIVGTRLTDVPAKLHATVDRIEAQSSFDAMDLAIVHVSGMDDMPSIQLDDSSQVAELDNLTVIGFPGLADESDAPVNLLTSSINRVYVSALKTTDTRSTLIQVSGNIEHGDSGGPALDESGHIVGIVSFGLVDPNETGSTSFLQTSNSARALLHSLNLNTAPGRFQQAWAQAFEDYAATTPGHWHKAAQELQNLMQRYPGFLGAQPYLAYAQSQASTEALTTTSSVGINAGVLIGLILFGVLVVLGAGTFVVIRRRAQIASANAAQSWSTPLPSQSAIPSVYGSPQINGSSGSHPSLPLAVQGQMAAPSLSDWPSVSQTTWPPVPETPSLAPQIHDGQTDIAIPRIEKTPQSESTLIVSRPLSSVEDAPFTVVASQPAMPQDGVFGVLSTFTPSATPFENVFGAEEPSVFSQEVPVPIGAVSDMHTWLAPCGHLNLPTARFCRVCGQTFQTRRSEAGAG